VLDHLDEVGVEQVEWVLHTHHHRDQCQGDARLVEHGASVAVPAREAALFEHVDAFWRLRSTYDDYDVSSDWNSLAEPIEVARRLADHETLRWHGLDPGFEALAGRIQQANSGEQPLRGRLIRIKRPLR
jgi:glyoxylase-like metal-dependent hydrolase (beta-lactamase superfamily II)